jgi:hypothetical protein
MADRHNEFAVWIAKTPHNFHPAEVFFPGRVGRALDRCQIKRGFGVANPAAPA